MQLGDARICKNMNVALDNNHARLWSYTCFKLATLIRTLVARGCSVHTQGNVAQRKTQHLLPWSQNMTRAQSTPFFPANKGSANRLVSASRAKCVASSPSIVTTLLSISRGNKACNAHSASHTRCDNSCRLKITCGIHSRQGSILKVETHSKAAHQHVVSSRNSHSCG